MSHTTMSLCADRVDGGIPHRGDKMQFGGAAALRRTTRTLQYFPYTDLTAPSENAKKLGAWYSIGLPLARRTQPSGCGGREKTSPGLSKINPFLRQRRGCA